MTLGPVKGGPPLAQRAFEGGVVVAILAVALASWVATNVLRPLEAPAGLQGAARYGEPSTQERFEALRQAGGGQALLAAGGLLLVSGVVAAGALVVLAARAGRPALREAWAKRTAGLGDEGPTILQAAVAFGVMTVAAASALPFAPRGQLEVQAGAPAGARAVPLGGLTLGGEEAGPGGEALPLEGLRERRAVLGPGGRLTLSPGRAPVQVDGVAPVGTAFDLREGARLEVGPLRATWRSAPAQAVATYHLVAGLAQAGALLLIIWPLLGRSAHRRVGLVADGLPGEVGRGLVGWLATVPLYLLVVLVWGALGDALGLKSPNHPLIGVLERGGLPVAALLLVQAAVLAPLAEELIFRGMVVPAFARVVGPLGAVLGTALLFGSIHPFFGSLAPIGLLGLLFAGLFVTSPSRSLAGSIVAHALHNGTTLLAAVAVQAATRP